MQVPKLARILALSQSQRALMTISSAAPFGLTNKHMRDLFTPTSLRQRGSIVYRGIGMGFWLYPCESTDTWAISATQDDAAWERCEGHVWLDLATSRARLDAVDRASEAGTYFGFGMERCARPGSRADFKLQPYAPRGTVMSRRSTSLKESPRSKLRARYFGSSELSLLQVIEPLRPLYSFHQT